MSLLYEVRGLVRRYGRVTALDLPALGVDELRIHSGQVLTLVGYNGSGKSTLLRLLAFLEEPDEGRIIYHGGEAGEYSLTEYFHAICGLHSLPPRISWFFGYEVIIIM